MKRIIFIAITVILITVLFVPESAAQCSQCKLLAEQSGNGVDAELLGEDGGNNINSAIIYIMVVPYIILSVLFRKQIKRFLLKKFSKQS